MHSDAYERFLKSTQLGYEEWHDGIGYDLDAVTGMSAEEKELVVNQLRSQPQGWREIEAYRAVATPSAIAALREALHCNSAETRLHAAEKLNDLGLMPSISTFIAKELSCVTIVDGMGKALTLAAAFQTAEIRMALLAGSRRPEVGVHYAATLCFLAGIAKTSFDMAMRPFFLRFGPHNPAEDRKAAYLELCQRVGMPPEA